MANYECACRTSYFRVDDEKRYKKLFNTLGRKNAIEDFTKMDKQGNKWHAFGSYAPLSLLPDCDSCEYKDAECHGDCDEETLDGFFDELSEIIRTGDTCVYFEAGHEKLRYIVGMVYIITKDNVMYEDIERWAKNRLSDIGYDPNYIEFDY